MNILMVYQSVVDTCASFFTLVTAVFQVDGTSMSRSLHDRFVCHIWLGRLPLYWLMNTSTYGILFTAFDRYAAVIYPIWYNNNVRTVSLADVIVSVIVIFLSMKFTYTSHYTHTAEQLVTLINEI